MFDSNIKPACDISSFGVLFYEQIESRETFSENVEIDSENVKIK
jgi:hypothetical protein